MLRIGGVRPEWRWVFEGNYFHIPFFEVSGPPWAYTSEGPIAPDGTTGTPETRITKYGPAMHSSGAEYYTWSDAILPVWFPQKDAAAGGTDRPCSALMVHWLTAALNGNESAVSKGNYLFGMNLSLEAYYTDVGVQTDTRWNFAFDSTGATDPAVVAMRYNGTVNQIWVNNVESPNDLGGNSASMNQSSNALRVGIPTSDGYATMPVVYIFGRALTTQQILQLGSDPIGPWQGSASVPVMQPVPPSAWLLNQLSHRWRNDDGNEAAATWAAIENSKLVATSGVTKRLRVLADATNNPDAAQYQLKYRRQGSSDPWQDIN